MSDCGLKLLGTLAAYDGLVCGFGMLSGEGWL